jgi:nitroreductase
MDKPAPVAYPVHALIQRRWSPRAFSDQVVEPYKICSLLEAARWAPSCFNEQPWRFFVGARNVNPKAHETLSALLMPGNHWAAKAPVLLLTVAKHKFSHNGAANRHGVHDVGIALENLLLQAVDVGLATHAMAGFYADKAVQDLMIPSGYEPMALVAIGYPGSPDSLDENLREREEAPRERRPMQELVFSDQWGVGFPYCFS